MGYVGLQQDDILIVDLKQFEKVERSSEIGWVDGVAELVLIGPLPRQEHSAVDPVIGDLGTLPILIWMLQVVRCCDCLEKPEGYEPDQIVGLVEVKLFPHP